MLSGSQGAWVARVGGMDTLPNLPQYPTTDADADHLALAFVALRASPGCSLPKRFSPCAHYNRRRARGCQAPGGAGTPNNCRCGGGLDGKAVAKPVTSEELPCRGRKSALEGERAAVSRGNAVPLAALRPDAGRGGVEYGGMRLISVGSIGELTQPVSCPGERDARLTITYQQTIMRAAKKPNRFG